MTPERFKQIRQLLGLSVQQLADRLGVKTGRTVRRYEQAPHTSTHRPVPEFTAWKMEQWAKNKQRKDKKND